MSSGDEHQGPKGAAATGSGILQGHGCGAHLACLPSVRSDLVFEYFIKISYFRLATQISRSITKNRDAFDAMAATDKVVQVLSGF